MTVMDGAMAMAMATAIEGAMTMQRRRRQWTARGRRRSKAQRRCGGNVRTMEMEGATTMDGALGAKNGANWGDIIAEVV